MKNVRAIPVPVRSSTRNQWKSKSQSQTKDPNQRSPMTLHLPCRGPRKTRQRWRIYSIPSETISIQFFLLYSAPVPEIRRDREREREREKANHPRQRWRHSCPYQDRNATLKASAAYRVHTYSTLQHLCSHRKKVLRGTVSSLGPRHERGNQSLTSSNTTRPVHSSQSRTNLPLGISDTPQLCHISYTRKTCLHSPSHPRPCAYIHTYIHKLPFQKPPPPLPFPSITHQPIVPISSLNHYTLKLH